MDSAGEGSAAAVIQRLTSGEDPFTHEQRFLLTRAEAARFVEGTAGRATVTTYDPDHPVSYTRTTYFDTTDAVYLSSAADQPSRRLRVRQYAVASTPDDPPVFSGVGFIELKQHLGAARSKVRVAAGAADIARLLADPQVAIPDGQVPGRLPDDPLAVVARELAIESMAPRLSTWYRRLCLTAPGETVRITLDEGLRFCHPQGIGQAGLPAAPSGSEVIAAFPARILEVKHCAALPGWLEDLLAGLRPAPEQFSKFKMGMQALAHELKLGGRVSLTVPPGPRRGPTASSTVAA